MIINRILKSNLLSKTINYKFSSIFNTIKTAAPQKPYPGFTPLLIPHSNQKTLIIQDPQLKLKFLVEQPGFPNHTDIAIGIKLGTQDETMDNSGSLKYLQQIMHSKPSFEETIEEYDFLQKSGSELNMTYDTSSTYVRMSFFPEDVDVMTDMILDVALSQKNIYEQGVQLADDLNKIQDLTRYIAFQGKGIGLPKGGIGAPLTNSQFLKFQQNITPSNTIISLAGYYNHEKLINIIKDKIKTKYPKFLQRAPFKRTPSKYRGGFHAFDHNQGYFQCAIVYESVPYKSLQYELFNILRKVIGKAESFSSGGPGKGMYARSYTRMLDKISYVMMANAIQQTYDQTGLFGLTVGGPSDRSSQLVQLCVKQLKHLRSHIGPQELQRAKNILLSQIYTNIQRQPQRLQQMTKQLFFFDRIKIEQFQSQIEKVTTSKVKQALTRIMQTPPTIVYFGDQRSIRSAPSQALVRQLLKA